MRSYRLYKQVIYIYCSYCWALKVKNSLSGTYVIVTNNSTVFTVNDNIEKMNKKTLSLEKKKMCYKGCWSNKMCNTTTTTWMSKY